MHQPIGPDVASARRDRVAQAAAVLERLRARGPRVHCITNAVAQNFTANALLAAGCVPSMTLSREEVGAFVGRADALLVNLGTLDAERREAIGLAIAAAGEAGVPWILDPVFVDRSAARADFARALLGQRPQAVRLNAAEFAALATADASPASLGAFARSHAAAIGLSGATDLIADGAQLAAIANGHALMARVTAMGCAASALVAACLAVEPDAFVATTAALLIVGVAGEIAGAQAKGPGSFAAGILDTLYTLDAETLAAQAKVS